MPPETRPADYKRAIGPREWSFPRDHGRHDGYRTEWWYFTGNLRTPEGRRMGYQLTFFRTAMRPDPVARPSPWGMTDLYFAHAAVTDVDGRSFVFRDRLERGRRGLAQASDETLDVRLLEWSAVMDPSGDRAIRLRAREPSLEIDLACTGGRGPVLQGPGGVNPKGRDPGQASYYYSMTRLATSGALTINGTTYQVEGQSWMDHEFSSNALAKRQVGWDWMGLHLASGDDLMIYRLRDASGGDDYLSGTRITPDGEPHYLSAGDVAIAGSHPWKSPITGGSYPQEWTLRCNGMSALVVRSLLPGQELVTPGSTDVAYFEGAAEVLDEARKWVGSGYLEMTGYSKSLGSSF